MTTKAPQRPQVSPKLQSAARALTTTQQSVLDSMGYTDNRPPLLAELVAAGYAPMDQRHVDRYKASKTRLSFNWKNVGFAIPAIFAASVISAVVWVHYQINNGPMALGHVLEPFSVPSVFSAVFASVAAIICYSRGHTFWGYHIRTEWYWKTQALQNYQGVADDRAWKTVADLQSRDIKDLRFEVESLDTRAYEPDEEAARNRAHWAARGGFMDPFLVAVRGDERYYLEVWDEPGFMKHAD